MNYVLVNKITGERSKINISFGKFVLIRLLQPVSYLLYGLIIAVILTLIGSVDKYSLIILVFAYLINIPMSLSKSGISLVDRIHNFLISPITNSMYVKDPYCNFLENEVSSLIYELGLSNLQKHFIHSRWLNQVIWMEGKAADAQKRYYLLRLTSIICGVIIPALVSLNISSEGTAGIVRWATFIISLLVAISLAIEEFFNYGERWRHYRLKVENLKIEGWEFFQLSGKYKDFQNHAEAYSSFAVHVEDILRDETITYINVFVKEKKKEMNSLIDELSLLDLQKRFIHSRWLDQVMWMESKAADAQKRCSLLRLTSIIGGVIILALVSLNISSEGTAGIVRWATFIISLLVAISLAIEEFFNYGERWRHYRLKVENLKREGWEFFQLSGKYKDFQNHAEAYSSFTRHVEDILRDETITYINVFMRKKKNEQTDTLKGM